MKINELPTPCYVIDENIIEENCKVLADVMNKTGCHVLLAQKAFSNYALYPLIGKYLSGTTASGLYEARLGREEMGRENHVFAPAYKDEDMDELVKIKKVIDKEMPESSKEVLMVLDATTGQNAISQVKAFKETVDINGLILTKLDGTAKGGVVVGIVAENQIPVKFIGVGEQLDDMQKFNSTDFVNSII